MSGGFSFSSSTFGVPATTANLFSGFGGQTTTANSPFAFGAPRTTAQTLSFGTPASTTNAFGTSSVFGASNPGFSFGTTAPATQAVVPFNFPTSNAPTTSTTGGMFGNTLSAAPSFGFSSAPTFSAPTFSFAQTSTAPSLGQFGFPNSFATTTTQSGGAFGPSPFALGTNPSMLGAPVQNPLANMATALSAPVWYGDERDSVLAKWNQLQAFWGSGKGYFAPNTLPVEFNAQNPFSRFKAVGYSCRPTNRPEEGLVGLIIQKKESEFRTNQTQYVEQLQRLFSQAKYNSSVMVDNVKALPEDKTELTIYVIERAPTGLSRRCSIQELTIIFEQPTVKSFLGTLSIVGYLPRVNVTKEQLRQYLDNPPAGIDPLLWQQAKLDNPDSEKLLPVPLVGFQELNHRLKGQEQETKQHEERLDVIAEDISELQKRHLTFAAKIAEHKRKQLDLGHRVLKLLVNQEIYRKMGFAIQVDEENLKVQMENIQADLNAPTQFKGRLNELLSQIRLQNQQGYSQSEDRYNLDSKLCDEIKQHLKNQQEGIGLLVSILKEDLDDLKLIESGLKDVIDRRRQVL